MNRDGWDIKNCAYEIATHGDLGQEVMYLISQVKGRDLDIEETWELIDSWLKFREI